MFFVCFAGNPDRPFSCALDARLKGIRLSAPDDIVVERMSDVVPVVGVDAEGDVPATVISMR